MGILNILIGPVMTLLSKIIPDPNLRAQAQAQLLDLQSKGELAQLDSDLRQALASAGIVQAEAQSSNWLTSSWRPLTMLTFVALIVCRVFGWTAHIPDAEYAELWSLVKLGLGGYVIGRTAEKTIAPAVSAAISAMGKKQ